jgi:hypothetical protein
MYVRPIAPLPNRGVIDTAIALYRESFRQCLPIALLGSLASAAFGLFVVDFAHRSGAGNSPLAMLEVYGEPPVLAAGLLQSVLALAFFGALVAIQNAIATGAACPNLMQALGIGFTRLGRGVIAAILSTALILIGFFVLLVPGLYYLGALCLWPVAIYADNAGAIQSLHLSRTLIRGHWWRSSSILSVAGLIVLVCSLVALLVSGLLAALWGSDTASAESVAEVVTALANVVVLPMLPAALVAVYQDLKLRSPKMGAEAPLH